MRLACLALPLVALPLLGGCSDPVPPTPQGATQVNFSFVSGCNVAAHREEIGTISATTRTKVNVDGVDGTKVTCAVTGSGPFEVDALITQGSNTLSVYVPSISPGATAMDPAKGSVQWQSHVTAGAFGGSCDFYFTEGTAQGVASGKIWAAFSCPSVVGNSTTCAIAESYVILENCDQ